MDFQVEGMKKACSGSMDRNPPKETLWKTFPHRLFFGRNSTPTWGPGGVAFLNPESNNQEKTYLCLNRITYVFHIYTTWGPGFVFHIYATSVHLYHAQDNLLNLYYRKKCQ